MRSLNGLSAGSCSGCRGQTKTKCRSAQPDKHATLSLVKQLKVRHSDSYAALQWKLPRVLFEQHNNQTPSRSDPLSSRRRKWQDLIHKAVDLDITGKYFHGLPNPGQAQPVTR